ncbi:MAG: hypothetical protein OEV00_13940, partial [Acidobacteriota bacterium]|nr:hypothetical protein [Acidobacteriota bacterium]
MIYNAKPYAMSPYKFRHGNFQPNAVGNDIVAFITTSPTNSTFEGLIKNLASMYDVDIQTLEADARAFLDDCIHRDILINPDVKREGEAVVEEIHKIQESIPELTIDKFGYLATLGKPWTPGCQSCSRGKWAVFNVGIGCNLDCWYCPYTGGLEKEQLDQTQGTQGGIEHISFMGL